MVSVGTVNIQANLERLQRRIALAAERAGRSPEEITLVGAAKTVDVERIRAAYELGVRDIGENYVQEAQPKMAALASQGISPRWHMIGHLQSNKVKAALQLFHLIETVDSVHLAEVMSRRAQGPVPILLEVNVTKEATKTGFYPEAVPAAYAAIAKLPNLVVEGLMTVAPLVANAEEVRPIFRQLWELRNHLGLRELSMGMTDDFEVAIEEGATMIRIGRALFGERPQ